MYNRQTPLDCLAAGRSPATPGGPAAGAALATVANPPARAALHAGARVAVVLAAAGAAVRARVPRVDGLLRLGRVGAGDAPRGEGAGRGAASVPPGPTSAKRSARCGGGERRCGGEQMVAPHQMRMINLH